MLVSDFDYLLPPELIAQNPAEPRHNSRLMVVDRKYQNTTDHFFYELPKFLKPGDLIVLNNTRVIPARLFAKKFGSASAHDGKVEIFLLKQLTVTAWECLVRPGKRAKPGAQLIFEDGMTAQITGVVQDGGRIIEFPADCDFRNWLARWGQTPLPPYITQKISDPERYQTIFAEHEGSVAAPTAGLHFTIELMNRIQDQGIKIGYLTLHVGIGTFRPVKTEVVENHTMHPESFNLSDELVQLIRLTKQSGGRVIAVGTTVVRVLESQSDENGIIRAGTGETNIFLYPGYRFRTIDGIITNFHLPKSTLLMLISAFAGRELILESYQRAIDQNYRFFSFGDAMLIL